MRFCSQQFKAACLIIASSMAIWAQSSIPFSSPTIGSFHALPEDPAPQSVLLAVNSMFLTCNTTLFEDRQIIDFEKREISFERYDKTYNIPIWQYRYEELDSYLESRRRFALLSGWYAGQTSVLAPVQEKKKAFTSLQWELPVEYPSWAQRILGKDPPKLSITGYEKIIVSYESNKIETGSNLDLPATGALNFDQENQFSITGSVGRLININIKGSTKEGVDAANDPLKNFKIEYKGEGNELEDEIVQEVVAGYTSFEMPGTQLSGFSESHEGLFGIKMNAKLGPLSLTGIASTEQGQSQTMSFSPTGAGESSTKISEKDFVPNKIFFLDSIYLQKYLGKRATVPKVAQLQVWLSNANMVNEAKPADNASKTNTNIYKKVGASLSWYKKLEEKRHYFLNQDEGWIRFDSTISESDLLGIYLVFSDTTYKTKGYNILDNPVAAKDTAIDTLWTLKFQDQNTSHPTFPLMWRNVYQLPNGFDQDKFKLRVTRSNADTGVEKTSDNKYFSNVLGLANDKGVPYTTNTQIFDNVHNIIVIPAFTSSDTSVRGNEPFSNPALGTDAVDKDIYHKTGANDFGLIIPKFQISMSGASRKTTFTLGFGSVMQGTEILKIDGKQLVRGTDYLIDYQTGQVDLISKEAMNANQISAEFQSEALFVAKQKVFFGLRGETKLPFSDKSILGMSILYQDASARENVPKLNQEPYSKLLLDVNSKVEFEPEWMTKAVNAIPLISTDAASALSIEVEVAHSSTNPNTSSGKDAYIDDFESSKEVYPMPFLESSWYTASPPPDDNNSPIDMLKNPPAWIQYWYAPLQGDGQPLKTDIFKQLPDVATQTDAEKYEPVLKLFAQPKPPQNNPYYDTTLHPWAGFMTSFPSNVANRSKDKFLEFWAKNNGGGRLTIDMGLVSEDISIDGGPPNGRPDLEDKNNIGYFDSLDVGLDGLTDADEYYVYPRKTATGTYYWDTLRYLKQDLTTKAYLTDPKTGRNIINDLLPIPGDPSKDNFQIYRLTPESDKQNFSHMNGTEKNHYLNSEDINGDGWHTTEAYYRRYIDFDSTNDAAFMSKNANNYRINDSVANADTSHGWHFYRIPLNDSLTGDCKINGSPSWSEIKFLRISWTKMKNDTQSVEFARMQFVGNQWQELSQDTLHKSKIAISTLNTEENKGFYTPPPTLVLQKDDRGNLERETSLKIDYNNILPGDIAIAKRSMSTNALNLSSYQNISLMVHGDSIHNDLWYVFRFGTDDSTYYECKTKFDMSNSWKEMSINLKELSDIKRKYIDDHTDTFVNTSAISSNGSGNVLSIRSPRGRTASFATITYMAMGVMRDSGGVGVNGYSGQVWTDELKVKGINPMEGFAGRAYLSTKWADFMNLSLGMDYEDGMFRRMTETDLALKSSSISTNFSVDWRLDKFMPADWGVSIPLGTRMQEKLIRPQIKPNSDIFLNTNGSPDGIMDMYAELVNMIGGRNVIGPKNTLSSHYQTATFSRNWHTAYEKKTASPNFFIDALFDRFSMTDLSYDYATNVTGRGPASFGGADRLDVDTTETYHTLLKYDLSPKLAPKWTKWKPFEDSKILWLPERIKGYEFNWLPTTFTVDMADLTYSREAKGLGLTGDKSETKKLGIDHRVNLLYDPINILNLSYNLTSSRNFDDDVQDLNLKDNFYYFMSKKVSQMNQAWHSFGVLYGERNRAQNLNVHFDPSFLDWLSHSFDYNTSYGQSKTTITNDTTDYLNLKSDATFKLTSTLNMANLFKNFSTGFSSMKALAETFNSIEKGIEKIALTSITFDYSAKASVANYYLDPATVEGTGADLGRSKWNFFLYQVGMSGRSGKNIWNIVTGDMDDYALGGMRFRGYNPNINGQDQRTSDKTYGITTNFALPEPIDLRITSIGLKWGNSYVITPDTTKIDRTTTFPDFSVQAQTGLLNKLQIVNRNANAVQVTSGFNYVRKQQERNTGTTPADLDIVTSKTYSMTPLFGVDGTLKQWPVNISYAHTWTIKTDSSSKTNSGTRTTDHDNKLNIRYEISKASTGKDEFKFLMWTIPVKGRVETGLEGDFATSKVESKTTDQSDYSTTADSWTLQISPHASYDFTENITGEVKYTGTRKKEIPQTTSSHIFSLSVTIRF